MYRGMSDELEGLLVHPGGPIWAKKDKGAWTIPKGEYEQNESPLVAARRQFEEETGFHAAGEFLDLGSIKQKGGKIVTALSHDDGGAAGVTLRVPGVWQPRWWRPGGVGKRHGGCPL